jgi:hypothetical protein
MKRMSEKSDGGVAGEGTLEERLREYPELRARFEEMLAIVENADGDIVKADEAEERVIEELWQLGQSALQGWAERKQRHVQKGEREASGSQSQVKNSIGITGWPRSKSGNKSINEGGGSGVRLASQREYSMRLR